MISSYSSLDRVGFCHTRPSSLCVIYIVFICVYFKPPQLNTRILLRPIRMSFSLHGGALSPSGVHLQLTRPPPKLSTPGYAI